MSINEAVSNLDPRIIQHNKVIFEKMKRLELRSKQTGLIKYQKRLLKSGELGSSTQGGVFNPGALVYQGNLHLLCRGESDDNIWFGRWLQSLATPIVCRLEENLAIAETFELTYDQLPPQTRPEDWRLFHYRGRLYANHSTYLIRQSQYLCRPGISEIDLSNRTIKFKTLLSLPFRPEPEEKNWAFFVHQQRLLAIYAFDPYIVLEIDLHSGQTQVIQTADALNYRWYDKGPCFIRLSTNPISWDEGHYILFIHDFIEIGTSSRDRIYLQYGVLIDKHTLLPTSIIPEPLIIGGIQEQGRHQGVHYTTSLITRPTELLAFYGEADSHTSVAIFDRQVLDTLFQKNTLSNFPRSLV